MKARRNRWMNLVREIRLGELMKLIPDDEFVIIFEDTVGVSEYREEDALFNGTVLDWWKDMATVTDIQKMRVTGFQVRELADTVGSGIMIVAEF